MSKVLASCLLAFVISIGVSYGQDKNLDKQIKEIATSAKCIVRVSILGIESRDASTYNGNARLVMHSVFKLPIAIIVLHLVDKGKYKPEQLMKLSKRDMPPKKIGIC